MKKRKITVLLLSLGFLFICGFSGCSSSPASEDTVQGQPDSDTIHTSSSVSDSSAESGILENSVSDNSVSDNRISDNSISENSVSGNTGSGEGTDRLQIVVFGDSIWDGCRDETGIAALVSQYLDADVYNCAIGGSTATLGEGIPADNYESWDSTSLIGMVHAAVGAVDPASFLSGYTAGSVIREIDFSKTDYFILAYGLNDYFSGTPLYTDSANEWSTHGYGSALKFAIERLRGAYPQAQILLISPTYCQFWEDGVMTDDSNMKDFGGGTLTDYANVCRNVAETRNTLYIDAYSTLGINIYTAEEYLEDGIHLTEEGRLLYARAVSSCIKYGQPGQVSGNSLYY